MKTKWKVKLMNIICGEHRQSIATRKGNSCSKVDDALRSELKWRLCGFNKVCYYYLRRIKYNIRCKCKISRKKMQNKLNTYSGTHERPQIIIDENS